MVASRLAALRWLDFSRCSLSFYVVLLFLVGPLWCAVPAAWTFVIYCLRSGSIWTYAWPGRTLFFAALCEVFFSVYHHNLASFVASLPPLPPGNIEDIRVVHTRVIQSGLFSFPEDGFDEESLDVDRPGSPAEEIVQLEQNDPRAQDFRNVLCTWFGHSSWSSIRLHEVSQWIYWSLFNADMPVEEHMPNSHRVILDEALDQLQKRVGVRIPEGSAPSCQPMRLTVDPVKIHWRPFFLYAAVGFINRCLKLWLEHVRLARFASYQGLEYMICTPPNWDSVTGPRPIVFIHGLGLGLVQYYSFVNTLLDKFPDRPILILIQPHISQDIFHPGYLQLMTRWEMTERLAAIMAGLGWVYSHEADDGRIGDSEDERSVASSLIDLNNNGVTMLSHSNGSYAHAWMLKDYPHMVARSCFVDPVAFCSWEGDVCYNFIYRPCQTGLQLLMRYFVCTELGVANLLQRHFDWSSNSLWYEEIPNARNPSKTLFLISAKDDIVRAERVVQYLRSHGIRKGLCVDPNGRHGQALIGGGESHNRIFRWLREAD